MLNWPFSSEQAVILLLAILAAVPVRTACGAEANKPPAAAEPLYTLRDGLDNCCITFEAKKPGRVAYLGGSITASPGWRDKTYDLLKKRFPETAFDFINAGVGGTNSTYGAFRLDQDVFGKGPVDLLFLEFAVNDDGGPSPDNQRLRAMEGIIRHTRQLNPKVDILMLYFADTGKVESYRKGKAPEVIQDHEKVATHYGIPVIYLAQEVTRRIDAGEFTWPEFSGDTCHPLERGHALYAECTDVVLKAAWSKPPAPGADAHDYALPPPLDPLNYEHARFVPLDKARVVEGWTRIPQWDTEKKCNYGGAVDVLAAEKPGAALELEFDGTLVAISAIAGMDAGILEVAIDGGAPQKLELFDSYCLLFHRPVCRVLAENLAPGKHLVRLTMAAESNLQSQGHAARILKFAVS